MVDERPSEREHKRVFLADGRQEVRSALRLLLEQEPLWKVVGEANKAEGLLERVLAAGPDLLLLDWELPESTKCCASRRLGEDLVSTLRSRIPALLIVTMSGRPEIGRASLEAGASGFVCKCEPPDLLLKTVRSVLSGGRT